MTPYPSEAVLTSMQARSRELSALLVRLNHGLAGGEGEPPNPGFEPDPAAVPPARAQHGRPHNPMPPLPQDIDPALETTGGWRDPGHASPRLAD